MLLSGKFAKSQKMHLLHNISSFSCTFPISNSGPDGPPPPQPGPQTEAAQARGGGGHGHGGLRGRSQSPTLNFEKLINELCIFLLERHLLHLLLLLPPPLHRSPPPSRSGAPETETSTTSSLKVWQYNFLFCPNVGILN